MQAAGQGHPLHLQPLRRAARDQRPRGQSHHHGGVAGRHRYDQLHRRQGHVDKFTADDALYIKTLPANRRDCNGHLIEMVYDERGFDAVDPGQRSGEQPDHPDVPSALSALRHGASRGGNQAQFLADRLSRTFNGCPTAVSIASFPGIQMPSRGPDSAKPRTVSVRGIRSVARVAFRHEGK